MSHEGQKICWFLSLIPIDLIRNKRDHDLVRKAREAHLINKASTFHPALIGINRKKIKHASDTSDAYLLIA